MSKICGMCKQDLLFSKFDIKNKVEGTMRVGNYCYCCKECQKIRNTKNYKSRTLNCIKCDNKKLIVMNPNTMKTRYVCNVCQPTFFMTKVEKRKYYRRKAKEKKQKEEKLKKESESENKSD